ncbi:hypothetical protein HAP94_21230 [Acidithiobacillus ferrivorans]|nr:hypothetical protein [Acidithiobacillus ferrivorans]
MAPSFMIWIGLPPGPGSCRLQVFATKHASWVPKAGQLIGTGTARRRMAAGSAGFAV